MSYDQAQPKKTTTRRLKVFLCHSSGDKPSVRKLYYRLREEGLEPWLDEEDLLPGQDWRKEIPRAVRNSDIVLVCLSCGSVNKSGYIQEEIKYALDVAQQQPEGTIFLIPLKLEECKVPGELANWQWVNFFAEPERGYHKLLRALEARANEIGIVFEKPEEEIEPILTPPRIISLPLEAPPTGSVVTTSSWYIEREAERKALKTLNEPDRLPLIIKAPGQMGRSSLLSNLTQVAAKADKRVVRLDFQQCFDNATLKDADIFYRQFCETIAIELELSNTRTEEFWQRAGSGKLRASRYMSGHILKTLESPLLLAMDEVDMIYDLEFRSDFFSMLRSWHTSRAANPIWKQLDLIFVTSAEPYQLIDNPNESPFNIGTVAELENLTLAEVAELNRRHGAPFNEVELKRLVTLVDGHPYLTCQALYLVADRQYSAAELLAQATDYDGPFKSHLHSYLHQRLQREDLRRGFQQVLTSHTCQSEKVFLRLQGMGLVHKAGRAVLPRCRLYEEFFREYL